MKILVLTSRYTANRDIIEEDFGRQVRLFEAFHKLGHSVDFLVADYRKFEARKARLHGINVTIEPFRLLGAINFYLKLRKMLRSKRYDYLFVSSDPLWSVFAVYSRVPVIYDIQDDYSIYRTFRFLLVRLFHHKMVKNAFLVTCASDVLEKDNRKIRDLPIINLPNGVDFSLFRPMEMDRCRRILGLPKSCRIVSYIGTMQRKQGVDLLIEAARDIKGIKLLLVGKKGAEDKDLDLKGDDIIYLGSLPYKKIPFAINASDVLAVPYPYNKFTRVMQAPYKMVEYMACNRPVVVTDVGSLAKTLDDRRFVARPSDKKELRDKISFALGVKKVNNRKKITDFSWDAIAKKLEGALKQ